MGFSAGKLADPTPPVDFVATFSKKFHRLLEERLAFSQRRYITALVPFDSILRRTLEVERTLLIDSS
ncbi:MAG: hypothetical protein KKE86_08750, partial [Planctomycetes bacterium]|nr:hypothetical protein [Planctomycetota bacterium]